MSTITYFEKPGPVNTDNALALAATRAKELAIETIILASSSGTTAQKAATIFPRGSLVIVTHSTGFERKDMQELLPKRREELEKLGCRCLPASMLLAG